MESSVLRALILLFAVVERVKTQSQDADVTVTLEQGAVKGQWIESIRDRQLLAFLGIPYAKPPVGDLRFKVRQEVLNDVLSTWNSMKLAVKRGAPVGRKEHTDVALAHHEVTKGRAQLANIFGRACPNCLQISKKFFSLRMGILKSKISSVDIATRYELDGLGIESRWGQDFPHPSRPDLWPTQPPIQRLPGLFPGGKTAGAWC